MKLELNKKIVYLFNSTDGLNSGITTYTKLLGDIFDWSDQKFISLNYDDDLSLIDGKNSIFIVNLGVNSLAPIHWLKKRGNNNSSKNIIIIHDLPYVTNNLFIRAKKSSRFLRLISRLAFIYLRSWSYKSLFFNNDILVVTNNKAYVFLKNIAPKLGVELSIRKIDHPLYYSSTVSRSNTFDGDTINIGSFGYGNRLKDFSIIAEALHRLKIRSPHLANRLKFIIYSKPIDKNGIKNRNMLLQKIERYNLHTYFSIQLELPEENIPKFFRSINVLLLPYRDTPLFSASGPVNYARSYQVPIVGSGSISKNEDFVYPFDINDVESLSSVLEQIALNSESWIEFVKNSKLSFRNNEWTTIIHLFRDLFSK